MINFNSIIAVSKEGRNAVITKYIPVDYFLQFKIIYNIFTLTFI